METELQSSLFQLTKSHSGSEAHVIHPGIVPAGASPDTWGEQTGSNEHTFLPGFLPDCCLVSPKASTSIPVTPHCP